MDFLKWQAYAKQTDDPNLLVVLSRHEETFMRSVVASNERTPPAVLAELATDHEAVVRSGVASNYNCSKETLDLLLMDPDRGVLASAASNPGFPPARFREWMALGGAACEEIARNPACPEEVMRDVLKLYPNSDVPHNLLMNPGITPGLIAEISASTEFEHYRAWIASLPKTPASVVQRLLSDTDAEVRIAALTHWACPVQFLTAAVEIKNFYKWRAIAGNARTPRAILLRLSLYEYDADEYTNEDGDEWSSDEVWYRDVLVALASNPMTPRHVVEKLAISDDGAVAEAAQGNPAMGTADALAPAWQGTFP